MSKHRKLFITCKILLCIALLTGCWDQRLLKDLKLTFTVGFDKGENNEIISHVAIRETKKRSVGGEAGEATVAVVEGRGMTLRSTRLALDQKIPGELSPSKTRVYLVGEELAKEDLYTIFDILYREPKAPLGAKLAIVKGEAASIIKLKTVNESLITEAVTELLENGEVNTLIANETVQSICPVMFDPASDFFLPVIQIDGLKDIEISGIGLISDRSYTGVSLNHFDSTILLLLSGTKGRKTQLNLMVHPEEEIIRNRYVTISIGKAKRKIKVNVQSKNDIKATVELKLTAKIEEYPRNHAVNKETVDELEKKAGTILEMQATEIIETIQSANSDVLKVGEELRVHHHEHWKDINWRETYPTIEIIPKISVKIVGTGIIN
ncbi:Ger(x)C family spore germination protein [Sutcliffiella halmapala]|uniref:Ger(x)C family spore germination protein n=1 Tax=Sutcliffiella halmapala TaxID=79882 RepID=UPI000995C21F|nr:Ger(x)C family spore germination protein [Sutcliffiella halmapala]